MSSKPSGKDLSLTARAVWFTFAKTLAFAVNFALPLLLVRRLSQNNFGLYKQVFLIVASTTSLIPLGFGMSAFYFLPREPERQGAVIFNILLFYTFGAGLFCLLLFVHPGLLATIFNSSELVPYAASIGLVIFLWAVSSFLELAVIAHQEFKLATLLIFLTQVARSLLMLSAAIWFSSIRALIYAAIIHGVLQLAVLLFYLRSRFNGFWRGFDWGLMRTQLAYAVPFGVASMLFHFQTDLHNYYVAHQYSAAIYAIYAVGCFNLPLVDILSDAAGTVAIPRVSYLQSMGRTREIIELIMSLIRKMSAVLFPLYVFLLVMGREFITLLFTEKYLASWPIFAINLTLILLGILANAYDPVTRAYPRHRYFLIRVRVVLLALLALALWLGVRSFGLVGAISAVVLVNLVERLVIVFKMGRVLGLQWQDLSLLKDVWKIAFAAVAAGLTALLARSLMSGIRPFFVLLVSGIFFSTVYLALALLLKVLTTNEREQLRGKLSSMRRLTSGKRIVEPLV